MADPLAVASVSALDLQQRRRHARTILVTGSSGSLGTHLARALRTRGHRVVPFDVVHGLDMLNVAHLKQQVLEHKVTDVVHLAAVADLNVMRRLGDEAWRLNVQGTANVASVCREHRLPLYFASTCCVYGNHDGRVGACHEGSPAAPTEIYAQSKLEGEQVVQAALPHGQFVCMRLATFYGEGCRPALAPHVFMERIMAGAPSLAIHGDGRQTRTYTHVADVVAGIVTLLEHEDGLDRPIVNVSATRSISVLELARACMDTCGRQVKLELVPDRPGQIYKEEIDAGVMKGLGWEAVVSLEEGLRRLHAHLLLNSDNNKGKGIPESDARS